MIALQTAIFTKLNTDLVPPVYDHVPQAADPSDDTAFPYVTIGDDDYNAWDTDDSVGYEVLIDVHVWSRKRGKKETKEIQQAIYNSLNRAELTVTGYDFISIDFTFADSALDPDGITRHGVIRFRCLLDEV